MSTRTHFQQNRSIIKVAWRMHPKNLGLDSLTNVDAANCAGWEYRYGTAEFLLFDQF